MQRSSLHFLFSLLQGNLFVYFNLFATHQHQRIINSTATKLKSLYLFHFLIFFLSLHFFYFPMFSFRIFVDRHTTQCPGPCSFILHVHENLTVFFFPFILFNIINILSASTFLFSLFRFCHLIIIWEGMQFCGMWECVCVLEWQVDNLFLLPVLSHIGFVEKMFVYYHFILFDYYYYGRERCQRCKKHHLYDNKNVFVDMWWWMVIFLSTIYHLFNH